MLKDNTIAITGLTEEGLKETEIVIPETLGDKTVKEIRENAFKDNSTLQTLSMPDTIEKIGKSAFQGCENLSSIRLSPNIEVIEDATFLNDGSLKSLILPKKLKTIDRRAFFGSGITELVIPESVESIKEGVIAFCDVETIIFEGDNDIEIVSGAFMQAPKLKRVILPANLSKIEAQLFDKCPCLHDIEIPKMVTEIKGFAFGECTSLESIEIPSRVKNISIWAFRECTNLSITIPETVESITDPYRENPFLNVKLVRLPSKFKSVITGAIRTEYY